MPVLLGDKDFDFCAPEFEVFWLVVAEEADVSECGLMFARGMFGEGLKIERAARGWLCLEERFKGGNGEIESGRVEGEGEFCKRQTGFGGGGVGFDGAGVVSEGFLFGFEKFRDEGEDFGADSLCEVGLVEVARLVAFNCKEMAFEMEESGFFRIKVAGEGVCGGDVRGVMAALFCEYERGFDFACDDGVAEGGVCIFTRSFKAVVGAGGEEACVEAVASNGGKAGGGGFADFCERLVELFSADEGLDDAGAGMEVGGVDFERGSELGEGLVGSVFGEELLGFAAGDLVAGWAGLVGVLDAQDAGNNEQDEQAAIGKQQAGGAFSDGALVCCQAHFSVPYGAAFCSAILWLGGLNSKGFFVSACVATAELVVMQIFQRSNTLFARYALFDFGV